jgi:uroporphyrinogen decarboxylase
MNKRELMLSLVYGDAPPEVIPAAFFLHFAPQYHQGQAAVDRHLEFFQDTGMDFVKVQYEQVQPASEKFQGNGLIQTPADWADTPRYGEEFFEPTVRLVEGLVQAVGAEALVILTLYSPYMWARSLAGDATLARHLNEDPEAVRKGLEIETENVLTLVRACKRVGVDGFYASTQGGEAGRFADRGTFEHFIKPTDLAVWDELESCQFNILHICDYEGGYDTLEPFLDYPGQVVNCSLRVGQRMMTPQEAARLFERPFMGGMERKGVISTGSPAGIRQEAEEVLAQAPERFILAADCTVPSDTPWDNLKTAIQAAHQFRRKA